MIISACFCLLPSILNGQTAVIDSTEIKFTQSHSIIDKNIGSNRESLERMVGKLKDHADSAANYKLKHIKVVGSASPEGSVDINRRLSEQRAHNIFNYFEEQVALDDSATEFIFLGRNWKGLYTMIEQDQQVPYRTEVLQLLSPLIQTETITVEDSNKILGQLKRLRKGEAYRYLYSHQFPRLRNSRLYVEYEKFLKSPEPQKTASGDPEIVEVPTDSIELIENVFIDEPTIATTCRPFYMGLKTNLLYDALLLPNIGAEFYIGKNWSIVGNWSYGWWDKNKTHWYWRAYGGDLAVRKWFGKKAKNKPLTGHHLGLYAGVLTYDFELGGTGYMGGRPGHSLWNRCLYTAGVEYGYALPIARRLNLDFTIGVGYIGGKIVKYHPRGKKYIWDSTRNFNGVLPTKLEVSLVWLLGCGNHN